MIHLSIQTLSTIFNNSAIDSSRTRGLISNPLCDESIISRPSEKTDGPLNYCITELKSMSWAV